MGPHGILAEGSGRVGYTILDPTYLTPTLDLGYPMVYPLETGPNIFLILVFKKSDLQLRPCTQCKKVLGNFSTKRQLLANVDFFLKFRWITDIISDQLT